MLDRKTKNIDASVELLEDRIDLIKKMMIVLYLVVSFLFILGIFTYFYTGLVGMTVIILSLALFGWIGVHEMCTYQDRIGLLIFLKKRFDKELK